MKEIGKNQTVSFLIAFRAYNEVNDREFVDDCFGILLDDGFLELVPLSTFDK